MLPSLFQFSSGLFMIFPNILLFLHFFLKFLLQFFHALQTSFLLVDVFHGARCEIELGEIDFWTNRPNRPINNYWLQITELYQLI